MRAARIENGVVVDLWEVPSTDCYGTLYTLVEAPEWVALGATWDGTQFTNPPEPPKTKEQAIAEFKEATQNRLDNFARTRDYDSILSACTYASSTNSKYAAEGQYAVQARDATWTAYYGIVNDIMSDTRPIPTMEEFLSELPALEWPEQN